MKWNKKSVVIGLLLVLLAGASRLLPHWHNFTAVGGVALFGAFYFRHRLWSYIVPLVAMWLSDLILNNLVYQGFHEGFVWFSKYMIWSYVGIAIMVLASSIIIKYGRRKEILIGTLTGTILFFLVTNFGAFVMDPIYLKTPSHLWLAYIAGLPFLLNSLVANIFFAGVLFGLSSLVKLKSSVAQSSLSREV
ncbi:MAG: hypothetical protein HKN76_17710 [Saprospiraceae bacterium]|nr:hypothetical protein [Saprospiraceae bacterium]